MACILSTFVTLMAYGPIVMACRSRDESQYTTTAMLATTNSITGTWYTEYHPCNDGPFSLGGRFIAASFLAWWLSRCKCVHLCFLFNETHLWKEWFIRGAHIISAPKRLGINDDESMHASWVCYPVGEVLIVIQQSS